MTESVGIKCMGFWIGLTKGAVKTPEMVLIMVFILTKYGLTRIINLPNIKEQ